MKNPCATLHGRSRWLPLTALVLWAIASQSAYAQDPAEQFTPKDPNDPTVRTDDPDVRADSNVIPYDGSEKCLVPVPYPQIESSVSEGCDNVPYSRLTPADYADGCPVPYPEPLELPIVPYMVPGDCEDYLRPDPNMDYTLYQPVNKDGVVPVDEEWLWRLRVFWSAMNQADVDAGGLQEFAKWTVGADLGFDMPIGDSNELQWEIGTQWSRYDVEVVAFTGDLEQVWNDYLNVRYFHNDFDFVNLMARGTIRSGEQINADFGGSLHAVLGLGAQVELDDDFAVGGAVAVMSQLDESMAVIPIPWITWQIDEDWRVYTDWNHLSSLAVGYFPDQWESYHFKAFYDINQFKLNDGGVLPDANVADEQFGLALGAEWRTSDLIAFTADVGVFLHRELEVHTTGGGLLGTPDSNPAPFFRMGLKVNF